LPRPTAELVDARGEPEIDALVENVDEIGLRIDAVELAGLNQRSDAGPVFRGLVMACEERVLTVENDRTDAALDDIRVQFDATIVKEADEPVPMVQAVAELLGDLGLAREAGQLLLEPGPDAMTSGLLFS
jgi:hypothetical protein